MTAAHTRHAPPAVTRLSPDQIRSLDPYAFLAVLGKRVIHPGGRRTAGLSDLHVTDGPFAMMTPHGFLADEGPANALRIAAHALARPSHLRKLAWLMPRLLRAVPYLGYVVIAATKPAA